MTAEQAEAWVDSTNQYIADEDEALNSARVSAELLLDALCKARLGEAWGTSGVRWGAHRTICVPASAFSAVVSSCGFPLPL
jgi:hypothetical protein